jgi:ferredoxin
MADERWLVTVDHEVCIGAGVCGGVAPRHFTVAHRRTVPVHDEVDVTEEDVLDAAACCPMIAIRVIAKATGVVVAPAESAGA